MPGIAIVGLVAGAAVLVDVVGLVVVRHTCSDEQRDFDLARSVVRHVRQPAVLIVPLAAVDAALPLAQVGPPLRSDLVHAVSIALVLASSFLVVRLTYVLDDMVLRHFRVDVADNLRARQVRTQLQVLRRIIVMVVSVVALAIVLLSFPAVRGAGAGLLASAGLAGIVGGLAARPTVANVVAGIQIALSQPIRVDDVVVVEGHWGRIEEIALTYVVVRVWDLRRLVVPVSYFVTNPFENWTRTAATILGWVYIDVDFQADVEQLRTELHRILHASRNWDGEVAVLQVTNVGATCMQLRALMSSPDSSRSWDLQCEVREQLVAFMRRVHPEALPRFRTVPAEPPFTAGPSEPAWPVEPGAGTRRGGAPPRRSAPGQGPPADGWAPLVTVMRHP